MYLRREKFSGHTPERMPWYSSMAKLMSLTTAARMEMRAGALCLAATEDDGSGTGRAALTAEAEGENAMDDARLCLLCSCAHVCSRGVEVELVSLLECARGSVPEYSGRA
jgi:hypothetical protein